MPTVSGTAISSETIVVGASDEETFGLRSGAAYVFERIPAAATEDPVGVGSRPRGGSERSGAAAGSSPPSDAELLRELDPSEKPPLPWLVPHLGSRAGTGMGGPSRANGDPECFELWAEGVPYCDDLELMVSGNEITGWWRNVLCAENDVPVSGTIREGRAAVRCVLPEGAPGVGSSIDLCPLGSNWGFVIELPLDGTMDLYRHEDGLWQAWIDEIRYELRDGPCSS